MGARAVALPAPPVRVPGGEGVALALPPSAVTLPMGTEAVGVGEREGAPTEGEMPEDCVL